MKKSEVTTTPPNKRKVKINKTWSEHHMPDMEKNTGKSQTIPEQGLSISQMLMRQRQGLPISSNAVPVWNGSRLLPDWKRMDEIDRQLVIEKTKNEVELLRKRKEKQEKDAKEAHQKRLEEIEKNRQTQASESAGKTGA